MTLEAESLTLVQGSGAPLAFDLGDIDVFSPADYQLTLTLSTGKKIVLSQFSKAFENLSRDLLEAYRKRLVECLLLEDLEEITRFDGLAHLDSPARTFSSAAEFRLYKSNLAVLPTAATGFQWRWADIQAVGFDETRYAVWLDSGGERLTVMKLAKRTREFVERAQESITEISEKSAKIARNLFPFLDPDQFQQVAQVMKESHGIPLAKLKAIHPKTEPALLEKVVDAKLKPYFETLASHVAAGGLVAGFKILRKEEAEEFEPVEAGGPPEKSAEESAPALAEEASAVEAKEAEPILYWFFFPFRANSKTTLPGNLVAWEATSKSGRATYFFRLVPEEQGGQLQDPARAPAAVDAALQQLHRALVLLNFRRAPIYLPDDSLEMQPHYRRYAIACRKIPELRRLRASFLGRALHTSFEAWQKQFETFLAKAST